MTGSIVDLDANFISTGPFQFIKTARPQEHLTLDRHGNIRIYISDALASTAYMFQAHLIARLDPKTPFLLSQFNFTVFAEYRTLD